MGVCIVVKARIGREIPCFDMPLSKIDSIEVTFGGKSAVLLSRFGLVTGV